MLKWAYPPLKSNSLKATIFSLQPAKNGDSNDEISITSKVNFDTRPILKLFVIALCAVSQPLNKQRNYKNGSACKFTFKSFLFFANDR